MMPLIDRWIGYPNLLSYLLFITMLWHGVLAYITPLSVDEAHYALYGLYPALSYFDHPPLVGWVQSVILMVSDHELALRLPALLSYALTLVLLHRFTLAYIGKVAVANTAILLFALMPMSFLLGMAVVPETLLMPVVIALVWQAQRTLNRPTLWQWAGLGLLIGVAGLIKYTAVLMAVGLLLVLLFSVARVQILRLGFWLALSIALLMMLPVLIWNAQHDWISILYQLNHGAPDDPWRWTNVLSSQLAQLLSYSPLVWLGAWIMTLTFWRDRGFSALDIGRGIALFSLPGVVVFTLASGKEPSLPHWLLFFYLLWLPWTAEWLCRPSRWQAWVQTGTVIYGLAVMSLVTVLIVFPQTGQVFTPNPAQDIFGWKSAGQKAQALRAPNEAILTPNWVSASRLAWYARPTSVIVLDQRYDQFDFWFGSARTGVSGLLLLSPEHKERELTAFADCQLLQKTEEGFRLYRCRDWQAR